MSAANYQKYCTVTSVDIKITFAAFKMLLEGKGQNLLKIQTIQMCITTKITRNEMKICASVRMSFN